MASNIEIKARARAFSRQRELAEELSDTRCVVLEQEDTFFNTSKGRLKLRIFHPENGELIYYERPDSEGPKQSYYLISKTSEPLTLKETLAKALGVKVVVRKRRLLYLTGQTRIHLDEVDGLGQFIEFEYVLNEGQNPEVGLETLRYLMKRLCIDQEDLINGAYADLLAHTSVRE
jgi:predicted adenylyl cyclase CyaB